jgi:hypothetical protein
MYWIRVCWPGSQDHSLVKGDCLCPKGGSPNHATTSWSYDDGVILNGFAEDYANYTELTNYIEGLKYYPGSGKAKVELYLWRKGKFVLEGFQWKLDHKDLKEIIGKIEASSPRLRGNRIFGEPLPLP